MLTPLLVLVLALTKVVQPWLLVRQEALPAKVCECLYPDPLKTFSREKLWQCGSSSQSAPTSSAQLSTQVRLGRERYGPQLAPPQFEHVFPSQV